MFFVPETDPNVLDEQFITAFPALNLKTTSNSGAYWGDGDGRAQHIDYNRLTFALESKARFSSSYVNCRPRSQEWEKALQQLHKFSGDAIRLFLVYHAGDSDWAVTIPCCDYEKLEALDISSDHKTLTLRRKGNRYCGRLFDSIDFLELYRQIAIHIGTDHVR